MNTRLLGSLVFILLFGFSLQAFAVPRASKYLPGETLDPTDCSPGETNCTVTPIAIGTEIGNSPSAGSILFADSSSTLAQNNSKFFWNNSTYRLGLGTSSPNASIDIRQTTNGTPLLYAKRVTDTSPSGDFVQYYNAAGDTLLYRVDNSGNVYAGGIINSGSQTITSTSTPQLRVQYDPSNEWTASTTSAGITTFATNGTTPQLIFTPGTNATNAFQFTNAASSPILNIDTTNTRVGIGTTSPVSALHVGTAPTASVNYGLVSLGSGAFDGSTSGYFTGSASGTMLAMNTASGYTGNFVDYQVAGSSKFVITGTGEVGIGTNPTSSLHVVDTVTGGNHGASFQITGSGVVATTLSAAKISLLAGYTGSGSNFGVYAQNQTAGTSTNEFSFAQAANYGEYVATTTGHIIGSAGYASGGNRSYGGMFRAIVAKDSATNIGVAGYALNSGASGIQIGGYFGLQNSSPTFASAALMADNGSTTSDIFVARDNGTAVFTIADGGGITAGGAISGLTGLSSSGTITFSGLSDGFVKSTSGVLSGGNLISLATDATGTLPVANGGTGTSTAFTQGSVVFAGASGTYSQDNSNFFWDDTNNWLGIGIAPTAPLRVSAGSNTRAIILGNSTDMYSILTSSNGGGNVLHAFENSGDGDNAWAIGRSNAGSFLISHSTGATYPSGTTNTRFSIGTSGSVTIGSDPTATANYGLLSLGSGAFNGSTSGYFVGSASGTILAMNTTSGYTGNLVDFQVAGSSKFAITGADGYVGIGTNTPNSPLRVEKPAVVSGVVRNVLGLFDSTSTFGAGVGAGITLGGTYTSGAVAGFAGINGVKESATDGAQSGNLVFWTKDGTTPTEAMRIDSSGNILIGTSTSVSGIKLLVSTTSAPAIRLSNTGSSSARWDLLAPNGTNTITESINGTLIRTMATTGVTHAVTQTIGSTTTAGTATTVISPTITGASNTSNFLSINGTMPTVPTTGVFANVINITGAGSASQVQQALRVDFLEGYTGSSANNAIVGINRNAGTGHDFGNFVQGSVVGNKGLNGLAMGTTTGLNIGGEVSAIGGNTNVGLLAMATGAKNSATNIGVLGVGLNTGTSPIQIGGYFGLHNADATFTSAALMADNGTTTSDIFVARDNGSPIFGIIDGGNGYITGNFGVGRSSGDTIAYQLDVFDSTSTYIASFFNDGDNDNNTGLLIQVGQDSPLAGKWIQFNDGDGGDVGSICYTGGQANICAPSDVRLKQNITDSILGLDTLMNIKVRDFSYISDTTERVVHGFVAQELNDIYPDAVFAPQDPDQLWKVSYSQLTPLIVRAVQDLNIKFEELKVVYNEDGTLARELADFVLGVREIVTQKLRVGSSAKPAGIILYDEVTKQPYCVRIANGALQTTPGECEAYTGGASTSSVSGGGSAGEATTGSTENTTSDTNSSADASTEASTEVSSVSAPSGGTETPTEGSGATDTGESSASAGETSTSETENTSAPTSSTTENTSEEVNSSEPSSPASSEPAPATTEPVSTTPTPVSAPENTTNTAG